MSRSPSTARARIGIDVGGTFTDFVLFDPDRNLFFEHKQTSIPADPSRAVSLGLSALLAKSGLSASDIEVLVHGTTLGLNAIIQRQGAPVALVVSRGFRDILEIGRARLPSSFDFHAGRPQAFLARDRVLEIDARFDADGQIVDWPAEDALQQLARQIDTLQVSTLALMLINGYTQPEEEQRLAQAIQHYLPTVNVLSAATLWPEIREYERTLVATLNAYIQPLMSDYFQQLAQRVRATGIDAPLLITASNGGVLPLASALNRPVDTLLSGPASGVVAALQLAALSGRQDIISFDMGGTSSDIALCQAGELEIATRTDIGGLPLVLPVVGVSAIGAGGGSLIAVDEYGLLKVGPQSAGADPGPAAYDRGGLQPTLTDAYLVCGIIDADAFLGGSMPLNISRAKAALAPLGERLGFDASQAAARAASGALAVATAQMASELHNALARRGAEPAGFSLVPFGGAGPTHANLLAEEAGLDSIIIPPRPGTFCARGAITARLRRDFVRSLRVTIDEGSIARINQGLDGLRQQAQDWFAQQGSHSTATGQLSASTDMRYRGQAYELNVSLAADRPLTAAQLRQAFHHQHQQQYGFQQADAPVELTTLRLSLEGQLPEVTAAALLATGSGQPQAAGQRRVFLHQCWHPAGVYPRSRLLSGDRIVGPAIIEQSDTTVLILPGWQATTDAHGSLHITRQSAAREISHDA